MGSYLITGGAGFIGSHLTERLLRDGHRVTVIDDLSTGSMTNLTAVQESPAFRFVEGDVMDRSVIGGLVAAADTVVHLAAYVGVLRVMEHPVECIVNNVRGTQSVLEAAVPGRQKVIVASTSEVYGKTTEVPFREESNLVLGSPSNVRWGYAASKIVDECLARGYQVEFGVPTIAVRPFNTIGPRQVGVHGMVVPRLVEQAIRGEDLTVYGDGSQSRCFTYVADTVEWIYRLSLSKAAVGEVFNLGNPQEITIRTLAETIIRITGSSSRIRYIPYRDAYRPGFEDMERRVPDCAKVVAATGHSPSVGLEESIRRIHAWLIESKAAPRDGALCEGVA